MNLWSVLWDVLLVLTGAGAMLIFIVVMLARAERKHGLLVLYPDQLERYQAIIGLREEYRGSMYMDVFSAHTTVKAISLKGRMLMSEDEVKDIDLEMML